MPRMALLLIGVLLLSGCARLWPFPRLGERTATRKAKAGPQIGQPAPELDAVDFEGKPVKLSDHRGKVVAVVFWATWCKPCRAMIPHERELVARFHGKPFEMISINSDDNPEAARNVIIAERMTWTNVKTRGSSDPLHERWGVEAYPSVYVIDQKGILRHQQYDSRGLDFTIEKLLAER